MSKQGLSDQKSSFFFAISLAGLLISGIFGNINAQNVGINATGATPNASAMLDVDHATKGLLIPRVALTALNNTAPIGAGMPASLLVYNTATAGTAPNNVSPGYYYWDGSAWVALAGNGGKNWSLLGNSGTIDGTHFLGTTDNIPLSFRVNNQKAGKIDQLAGNVFFGYLSGNVCTGTDNAAFGHNSFAQNTTGSYNTSLGNDALAANVSGDNNTAVGNGALLSNTVGIGNTAIGSGAMTQNKTGSYNSSVGYLAMQFNSGGSYNTAEGPFALLNNVNGTSNVALGSSCMYLNNGGSENTAAGRFALYGNVNGNANTAIGYYALRTNTGSNNTAIGHSALYSNSTGGVNIAVGTSAAYFTTSGYRNVAMGNSALYMNTTGSDNTAIGSFALQAVSTGSNNIGIGASAAVPVATNSNQVRIGNTAITYAGVQVAWSVTSDARWKKDIRTSDLGLDFIKRLRPVCYLRSNDESRKTEYGFIAQDVKQLLADAGASESGVITTDDEGMLSMRYNDLLAPIVKAIQEQQALIDELKKKNEALERRLEQQENIHHK